MCARGLGVDAVDDAMRVGRAHDHRISLAGQGDVVGIAAMALDQRGVLGARHRLADAELGQGPVGRLYPRCSCQFRARFGLGDSGDLADLQGFRARLQASGHRSAAGKRADDRFACVRTQNRYPLLLNARMAVVGRLQGQRPLPRLCPICGHNAGRTGRARRRGRTSLMNDEVRATGLDPARGHAPCDPRKRSQLQRDRGAPHDPAARAGRAI